MMKIFKLAGIGILFLTLAVLSGCVPIDYLMGGRRQVVHYRGVNHGGKAVTDEESQYNKSKQKGEWEAEYKEGKYKTKQKGNWETEYIEGKEGAEDDGDEKSDEYCEPVYTFDPPSDYADIECSRQCYRRQDKCREDIRLKRESCEHFNAMARIEFGRCLASGALNCLRGNHECLDADTTACEEEYRRCYENCGGIVNNSCDE